MSLLEKAADRVMEIQDGRMAGPGTALYSLDTFREVFGSVVGGDVPSPLSETDAKVLLKYLERERGVAVVEKGVRRFRKCPQSSCTLTWLIGSSLNLWMTP